MKRLSLVLLLASTSISSAVTNEQSGKNQTLKGTKFTGLPLSNFTSDDGVGYGVRLSLFNYDGHSVPYRHTLSLQAFFTTKGVWAHRLYMDAPDLVPGQRFEVELKYSRKKYANYFGELSDRELEDLARNQKTYREQRPSLRVNWIRDISTKLKHRVESQVSDFSISPNTDSANVLTQLNPIGVGGGIYVQTRTSIRFDTRDDYNNATRGVLEEIQLEYGFGGGGDFDGWKIGFQHRHFLPIAKSFVLAYRAAVDHTIGDVPFFDELKVGGENTVRGEPAARVRSEGRVMLNMELRWRGLELYSRQKLLAGLVTFLDLGQAYHRNDGPSLARGWRKGVGAGLRLHWFSTIVRVDYGFSTSGSGFYMLFDHVF
jgi:outer membrane protein assembly factor BamA